MDKLPHEYTEAEWSALDDIEQAMAWGRLERALALSQLRLRRQSDDPNFMLKWESMTGAIREARKAAEEAVDRVRVQAGLPPLKRVDDS